MSSTLVDKMAKVVPGKYIVKSEEILEHNFLPF